MMVNVGANSAINVQLYESNKDGQKLFAIWKFRRVFDSLNPDSSDKWVPMRGKGLCMRISSWKKILPEIQKVLDNA